LPPRLQSIPTAPTADACRRFARRRRNFVVRDAEVPLERVGGHPLALLGLLAGMRDQRAKPRAQAEHDHFLVDRPRRRRDLEDRVQRLAVAHHRGAPPAPRERSQRLTGARN
jgi:hypothetical protein